MLAVLVRIWGGQNDKFRLIIEWEVHLPSLQYLGDQVSLTVNCVQKAKHTVRLHSVKFVHMLTVTFINKHF